VPGGRYYLGDESIHFEPGITKDSKDDLTGQ
jgi:hypothetical protein